MVLTLIASTASRSGTPGPQPVQTLQVALLMKGRAWTPDRTPEVATLQQAHAAHLSALGAAGHLLASGTVSGDGDIRGLLILRVADAPAALTLLADDPAVQAERLRVEVETLRVPANWFTVTLATRDAPIRSFIVALLGAGPAAGAGGEGNVPGADLEAFWRLRESGVMVLGGAFERATDRRGLLVFASDNVAAIRGLVSSNASVTSGRITVDLLTWFGPDGVMKNVKPAP